MGVVYAARDTELARDIALKVVRPRGDVDAMQARLRREARAMAQLRHPNVVEVFDIGSHDGRLFIAMELVPGETLRPWVAQPRPWRAVVALFAKAGRGLAAAHAERLVHRDFKPDNVVIGADDEPRITDFGLARELDDVAGAGGSAEPPHGELSQVTATGSIAGTPAYMAPEQLRGERGGAAADQFGFCVSLFEVLYGARPFQPATIRPEAQLAEIRAGRIARPADGARGRVPRWLQAAIARGLAFEPAQRWPSMAALIDALERGRRRRRRAMIGAAAALVVAVIAGSVIAARRSPAAGCRELARRANDANTIVVCRDEYARSNDPDIGLELANALRRDGKLDDARTLANELLASRPADARYTLGKVAIEAERYDEADQLLRGASELHRKQERWADAATDEQALAGISRDFVEQLAGFDRAVVDARRGNDARIEGYSRLSAADVLSKIGARAGALDELERAAALLTERRDVLQVDMMRGNVLQNLGDNAPAVVAFARAAAEATALTNLRFARSARGNAVYSLAESGRLDEAARELEAVTALEPGDASRELRLALAARIARHRGELRRAAELIDQAIAACDRDAIEDLVERHVERAEIALDRGDLATAEQSARRAIAGIETLRSTHPPVELRSWMISDRRAPYRLLFEALARRGDAGEALAVFDGYRGVDVLAGLAHGTRGEHGRARDGLAFPVDDLARGFAALPHSALATPATVAIRDAIGTASLLALVAGPGAVWRITAEAGQLRVDRIGELAELQPRFDELGARPGDRALAGALGELLVPRELARPSDRTLHVVLDEPLAGLPVSALRVGDRRLVALRPVVHAARASDLGCAIRSRGSHRVVALTDTGALFDAARDDLLAIAVPIASDELGDALVLRDGRVRALEIAGRGGAPAQIVLAARDAGPGGTAGLAMAFLAAGADQVIATLRPVSPATTQRLSGQLARSDVGDLARALARIQATADDDELGFAAFGRDICNPSP